MENLISVIVPVYKVENYLDKCLKSILTQTYSNLEIILVDDGSPDQCGEICDQYARVDPRIRVIHKANGGLSDARNAGVSAAKGQFLAFVDSDDFIHPQMYELLFEQMMKQQADIVICDFQKVTEDSLIDYETYEQVSIHSYSGKKSQELYFDESKRDFVTVAWNKLYKKESFQNVVFPAGRIHEDEFTSYRILYPCAKIIHVCAPLYYYVSRKSSIMSEFNTKRFDLFEAYLQRIEFYLSVREVELCRRMLLLYMRMMAQYSLWVKQTDSGEEKVIKLYRDNLKRFYNKNKQTLPMTVRDRMECRLFCISMKEYIRLWNIFR